MYWTGCNRCLRLSPRWPPGPSDASDLCFVVRLIELLGEGCSRKEQSAGGICVYRHCSDALAVGSVVSRVQGEQCRFMYSYRGCRRRVEVEVDVHVEGKEKDGGRRMKEEEEEEDEEEGRVYITAGKQYDGKYRQAPCVPCLVLLGYADKTGTIIANKS